MRFALVPVVFALSLSIVAAAPMDAGSSSNEPEYKPPVIVFSNSVPQNERQIITADILKFHKNRAEFPNSSFDSDIAGIWPGVTATVESGFGDHTGYGVQFAEVYFELGEAKAGRMAYQVVKPGQKKNWSERVPPK